MVAFHRRLYKVAFHRCLYKVPVYFGVQGGGAGLHTHPATILVTPLFGDKDDKIQCISVGNDMFINFQTHTFLYGCLLAAFHNSSKV